MAVGRDASALLPAVVLCCLVLCEKNIFEVATSSGCTTNLYPQSSAHIPPKEFFSLKKPFIPLLWVFSLKPELRYMMANKERYHSFDKQCPDCYAPLA